MEISELREAHDALSEQLEDPDAGNDEVREAALEVCNALNEVWPYIEQINAMLKLVRDVALDEGETVLDRDVHHNMIGEAQGIMKRIQDAGRKPYTEGQVPPA